MSAPASGSASDKKGPTLGQMGALWLPMAASIVMMVLEPSIVNFGLARTRNVELALAAYGVAYSLALLVEAPVLMLLDASVARSTDRAAFSLVRRFSLVLGLVVAAIGLALTLTPLYGLLVREVMNIPADVAEQARPTLAVLSLWPLPIGWRRVYQGVLIRAGRTRAISLATMVRLVTLAAMLSLGLLLFSGDAALIAGVAMDISVFVESGMITWMTRPILRSSPYHDAGRSSPAPGLTARELWRFYRPLVTTTIVRQATRPMLSAGIAAAAMAFGSLAAWPVAWGVVTLFVGPVWSLQQLTTAMVEDRATYQPVRRFSLLLSLGFSLLLALIAFTDLYGLVMGRVYNLPPDLQALARPGVRLMVTLPLLMGAQSLLRGVLIRQGSTHVIQTATIIGAVVQGVVLVGGVMLLEPIGVTLAAMSVLTGGLVELAWLRWRPGGAV